MFFFSKFPLFPRGFSFIACFWAKSESKRTTKKQSQGLARRGFQGGCKTGGLKRVLGRGGASFWFRAADEMSSDWYAAVVVVWLRRTNPPPLPSLLAGSALVVEAADAAADWPSPAVDAAQPFGNALYINFVAQVPLENPVGGKIIQFSSQINRI